MLWNPQVGSNNKNTPLGSFCAKKWTSKSSTTQTCPCDQTSHAHSPAIPKVKPSDMSSTRPPARMLLGAPGIATRSKVRYYGLLALLGTRSYYSPAHLRIRRCVHRVWNSQRHRGPHAAGALGTFGFCITLETSAVCFSVRVEKGTKTPRWERDSKVSRK